MLDYVGFKVHVLLKQKKTDWVALDKTAIEGAKLWKRLKKRISDSGLRDAASTAIKGMHTAAKSKNIEMLNFAAQVDLDLVDLLEGYFRRHK